MSAGKALFDGHSIREQLESYLMLGFHPIHLEGKVARYHWKQFNLTRADIGRYLGLGVNWGMRTDRLDGGAWFYVVDLDQKNLLAEMYEHCPGLMEAPVVSTGKGFHIYLTWKEEVRTRHFGKADIIGNGYVVAPPSVHPRTGRRYTFVKPLNAVPPLVDPESIILEEWGGALNPMLHGPQDKLAESAVPTSAQDHLFAGAPEGQRHNALVHYLAILFHCWSVPEEEALALALEQNKRNKPPLPVEEVVCTTRSCYRAFEERWRRQMEEGKERA